MVKIITDSCSDLNAEQLERYGIDYAKMTTSRDGVEAEALLGGYGEVRDVYEAMRNGERVTTAQVSVPEFERIFEKYLSLGMDVVYVGCSSKQSGSVNTAYTVAKRMEERYAGRKVICIDSLNASMGEGMLAIEAARLAESGMDADGIAARIFEMRYNVNQFVTVHTLDYLRRAGRVKATSAFLGNLMGAPIDTRGLSLRS